MGGQHPPLNTKCAKTFAVFRRIAMPLPADPKVSEDCRNLSDSGHFRRSSSCRQTYNCSDVPAGSIDCNKKESHGVDLEFRSPLCPGAQRLCWPTQPRELRCS